MTQTGDVQPESRDFLFGGWRAQPSLNRVTHDGVTLHMRPQLMDVLVCLARGAGRTVHRDELMRQVWPGQTAVADSALARCIAELRHMLGDEARSPTLIETIPKRGYRLIPPVAIVEPQSPDLNPAVPRPEAGAAPPPLEPGLRRAWVTLARRILLGLAHACAGR